MGIGHFRLSQNWTKVRLICYHVQPANVHGTFSNKYFVSNVETRIILVFSLQILVWKYPSLVQVAKLTGHSYRVLYLAMSPDGESIVTGAGDETLRFWNVFSKTRSQKVTHKCLKSKLLWI